MIKEYPVRTLALPNGETMAYREAGAGEKTLLLIHGNMSSSIHWDVLIEQLEGHFKVYAVDLRGFGDSTYNRPIDSIKDFADDVKAFVTLKGINQFAVAGWSTGGGVALELAAELPEQVIRVILLESVGVKGYPMFKKDAAGQPILTELIKTRDEIASDAVQVVPILAAYATGNCDLLKAVWNAVIYNRVQPEPARYERYLEGMLKQRNLVDVDYALITFNMTDEHNGVVGGSNRLNLVQGPVLVIQGELDYVVPASFGHDTANRLGNRAQLALMPNCGHSPLTDDLAELLALFINFLS
ncbi:MAG: alpha/beta hydrolase [Bacillota bacterium]|nr:MAG: alpha/beta hydrolase [Bacillota bacterium]